MLKNQLFKISGAPKFFQCRVVFFFSGLICACVFEFFRIYFSPKGGGQVLGRTQIFLLVLIVVQAGEFYLYLTRKFKKVYEELGDRDLTDQDLEVASFIQQLFVPPPLIKNEQIKIVSFYRSAVSCGGDLWDYFSVKNKGYFIIADATGHGVASALVSATLKGGLCSIKQLLEKEEHFQISAGGLLSYANRIIFESSKGQIWMSGFAAVIDFEKKTITYSNASHPPGWLFKSRNDQHGFGCLSLTALSGSLGRELEIGPVAEETLDLSEKDFLFFYTDGLIEAQNIENKRFGKKRVKELIHENIHLGSERTLNALLADFLEYNHDKPLDDDVTLLLMQFSP